MRRLCARNAALLLVASCLATGCLNVGHEFPVEPVRKIEIGATTREDVRTMFGAPWRTGIEDGERTWTYGRYRYSLFGDAATRDLVVRFDARGVVTSYAFNSTHAEDAEL
jgi:outer membrane protein assembly factor BamE (lipoprotein component of BamABCDE complex)